MKDKKRLEYARKYRRKNRKKVNQYYREYFKKHKHKNYSRMYRLRLEAIKRQLERTIVGETDYKTTYDRISNIAYGMLDDELLEEYEAKNNGKK